MAPMGSRVARIFFSASSLQSPIRTGTECWGQLRPGGVAVDQTLGPLVVQQGAGPADFLVG